MQKQSLVAISGEQLDRARSSSAGRSAVTVYGGHDHVLRQTLLTLTGGTKLGEHENPGEATLYVVSGSVQLHAGNDTWEGRDGDLLVVPPTRHDLHAITDAAVLLTVAKR